MEFKLKKLTLENFKGFKSYDIEPDGKTVRILGANKSGKTTLADAYNWILFNKDSLNKADFGIKTLKNDETISGLDHSVEAIFEIDGKEASLKKTYKEKWTKKRGHHSTTLTGHETVYEINGAPKKKAEFNDYIKEFITDMEVFRLVSDPLYFSTLDMDKRRDIVMEVTGGIDDLQVVESDDNLNELKPLLEKYTMEELKDINKRDKKAVNDKLKSNPIRIDEIYRNLEEVETAPESVKKEIDEIEKKIDIERESINDLQNGVTVIDLKNKMREREHEVKFNVENSLRAAENDLKVYLNNFDEGSNEKLRKLSYKNEADKSDLEIHNSRLLKHKEQLKDTENQTNNYRENYKKDAEELNRTLGERKEFEVKDTCNCCGQKLPEEEIEAHRERQQERYNEERAKSIKSLKESLESLSNKGKESSAAEDNIKDLIKKAENEIERIRTVVEKNESQIKELQGDYINPKDTEQYKELNEQVMELKKQSEIISHPKNLYENLIENDEEYKKLNGELLKLSKDNEETTSKHEEAISTLKEELSEANTRLSQINSYKKDLERIEELKVEQEELAEEYERLEGMEDKLNVFTTSKVKLVESNISSKFKNVRFKLFKELLNGGLEERCDITLDGVPYDEGLNTEGKMNAGLDIINTLSKHYNFIAPIVIDNAESVTDYIDTEGQQIRLTVSAKNKKLKMESVDNE